MTQTLSEIFAGGNAILNRAGDYDIAEYGDGRVEGGVSSGNRQAWHGLLNLRPEELLTMETAFEAYPPAGLPVHKEEIYTKDGILIPNKWVTIREDRVPLGVVGNKFKVFQNRSITELATDIMDLSGAGIETMVNTRSGARFFVVFRIPKSIRIAGLDEEEINLFLMLSNGHDGSAPLRADVTPVRAVCENSQVYAIKTAPRSYVLRHTSAMDGRVNEIRRALDIAFTYTEALEATGNAMVTQKLRGSDFTAFLNKLVSLPEDQESRAFTMRKKTQDGIRSLYAGAENLEYVRGTRWAALQAVTEWNDHYMGSRETSTGTSDENRFERIIEGDKASLPNRALALLT